MEVLEVDKELFKMGDKTTIMLTIDRFAWLLSKEIHVSYVLTGKQ